MRMILAVDDNQDDLFLLKRTLALSGVDHRLLTAGDGAQAEALLDDLGGANTPALPSLIFLDAHMPRLSGFDFLDRVKHKPRCAAVPVVMLSSFDDPRDVDKAFELGAAACLHKPPAPREVRQILLTLPNVPAQSQGNHNDCSSPLGAPPAAHNRKLEYDKEVVRQVA